MSAPLTSEEVAKVAVLSRLKLNADELPALASQLGRVLEYVDVLNELETEDVEPMAHAVELSNVFRDDEIQDSLTRDEALANAPRSNGRFFLVPQILDGG